MDQPTFWLRKINMSDMPKDAQKSWKMIALKLELISLVRNKEILTQQLNIENLKLKISCKNNVSKLSQIAIQIYTKQ